MKVVATRDVTFDETKFYDPDEPDLASQLHERAEQILEVIEVSSLPQPLASHDLDTESDTEDEEVDDRGRDPENIGQQRSQQENSQTSSPTDSSTLQSSSDFTLQSSRDDTGHFPELTTPEETPEPCLATVAQSAAESLDSQQIEPGPPEPTRLRRAPRDIVGDVIESNIVEGPRARQKTDKARKQVYFTDLGRPNELPGYYAAFAVGIQHSRDHLHRDQLPPPPRNWKDLSSHPHREGFQAAARKEYQDLERRDTFQSVPKTVSTKTLPLKWVFTYKFDTNGYLVKFKARICVRGDLQESTYKDTYAATLAARTFRALMAVTAAFDLEAWQFDAVNAFTNSDIDETIYCEYPEGFEQPGNCLLLLRALYGLCRSPLLWHKEFSKALTELGLTSRSEDTCLYTNDWLSILLRGRYRSSLPRD